MNNLHGSKSIYSELADLREKHDKLLEAIISQCPECEDIRFKDLFSNAASAIAILDEEGKTLLTNSAFTKITGYAQADTFGSPMHKILMPDHDETGKEFLKNLFCGPECQTNLSISIIDKFHKQRFIDMSVASISESAEAPKNCICILHDVTTEKENELRREELIEELMEVKEIQEDNSAQLATLLHELDEKNLELEQEIAERKKAEQKLKESEERFKNLSITDQLTGLFNRRHMQDVAEKEIFRSCKSDRPLSIMLMDVDDFKRFNDTYGHAAGDDVLETIGMTINASIRPSDSAFRYGGEEFLVILPDTDGKEAIEIAEKIRSAISRKKYRPEKGRPVNKTVSIGVAEFQKDETLEKVLKRADDNMYQCKIKGKNRIYFSCEIEDASEA